MTFYTDLLSIYSDKKSPSL